MLSLVVGSLSVVVVLGALVVQAAKVALWLTAPLGLASRRGLRRGRILRRLLRVVRIGLLRVVLVVVLSSVLSVSSILRVLVLHGRGDVSSVLSLVHLLLLLLLLLLLTVHGRTSGFLFIWLLGLLGLLLRLDRPGGGLLGLLGPVLGLLLVPRVSTITLVLHVRLRVHVVHLYSGRAVLLER